MKNGASDLTMDNHLILLIIIYSITMPHSHGKKIESAHLLMVLDDF